MHPIKTLLALAMCFTVLTACSNSRIENPHEFLDTKFHYAITYPGKWAVSQMNLGKDSTRLFLADESFANSFSIVVSSFKISQQRYIEALRVNADLIIPKQPDFISSKIKVFDIKDVLLGGQKALLIRYKETITNDFKNGQDPIETNIYTYVVSTVIDGFWYKLSFMTNDKWTHYKSIDIYNETISTFHFVPDSPPS